MAKTEVRSVRILCFGDSNTYGYDPRGFFGGRYDAGDRWVDLLAGQTGHECIQAGTNGREIPQNGCPLASGQAADLFLIMLGTNDLLEGASARDAADKMEQFLKKLLPFYAHIILMAPPPLKRGAWVPTDELVIESICLAQEYQLLAEKLEIPFVDTRSWNIALSFDGVHFTESGHHTFAERLAKERDLLP
jgi:lysophospholipase L1-like esterase